MTAVDYVIVLLTLASVAVGAWRGFTTEAMSLITLLAAVAIAWLFAGQLEPMLGEWSSALEVRLWAARVVIFVAVLIVGGLVSWVARKLVRTSGLTSLDRMLGGVFGLARAGVFLGLAVLVIQFMAMDQEPWWREASLRPYAEQIAATVKYYAEVGTRYLQDQPVGPSVGIESVFVVSQA
ncbi:MAG TPA: CvpA family protein [Gammaproteobacteria bacterium]|nr:CvpA family protein [Gammaproteobacteria bacterium]